VHDDVMLIDESRIKVDKKLTYMRSQFGCNNSNIEDVSLDG
jgi:hypothetical protein